MRYSVIPEPMVCLAAQTEIMSSPDLDRDIARILIECVALRDNWRRFAKLSTLRSMALIQSYNRLDEASICPNVQFPGMPLANRIIPTGWSGVNRMFLLFSTDVAYHIGAGSFNRDLEIQRAPSCNITTPKSNERQCVYPEEHPTLDKIIHLLHG